MQTDDVKMYPVERNGGMVFMTTDPRHDYPDLVVNEFAQPADYPSGPNQVLGRKTDDPTVFQAFPDDETAFRNGFDPITFMVVPNWDHYLDMIENRKKPR